SARRNIMDADISENEASRFVEAARIACVSIERLDGTGSETLRAALIGLLDAAEGLADCRLDPGDPDALIESASSPGLMEQSQDVIFHEVFDPLDPTSVTAVSLKDCLGDIYGSLKGGLRVIDQSPEKKPQILWEWRNDYQYHWRRHLIDTIRFFVLSTS